MRSITLNPEQADLKREASNRTEGGGRSDDDLGAGVPLSPHSLTARGKFDKTWGIQQVPPPPSRHSNILHANSNILHANSNILHANSKTYPAGVPESSAGGDA